MLLRPFNRFGGNGSKRRNNSRKKLGVCEREIAYVLYKIKLRDSVCVVIRSDCYGILSSKERGVKWIRSDTGMARSIDYNGFISLNSTEDEYYFFYLPIHLRFFPVFL